MSNLTQFLPIHQDEWILEFFLHHLCIPTWHCSLWPKALHVFRWEPYDHLCQPLLPVIWNINVYYVFIAGVCFLHVLNMIIIYRLLIGYQYILNSNIHNTIDNEFTNLQCNFILKEKNREMFGRKFQRSVPADKLVCDLHSKRLDFMGNHVLSKKWTEGEIKHVT